MNIRIECPSCKQKYSVDESLIGEEVECSFCNHVFVAQKKIPIKLELPSDISQKTTQPKITSIPAENSPSPFCQSSDNKIEDNTSNIKKQEITEQIIPSKTTIIQPAAVIEESSHSPEPELAGPWRRWAARFIDISIEAFFCAVLFYTCFYFVMGAVFFNAKSSYGEEVCEKIASWLIDYIFAPAFAFLLDSIVYVFFKGTLGKWLFGVKVLEETGEKPKASRYFSRNFGVLLSGCGLCIPVVAFFTALAQYNLVSKGEPTSYDLHLGFKSIKNNCTYLKTCVGVVLVVIFIAIKWAAKVLMQ